MHDLEKYDQYFYVPVVHSNNSADFPLICPFLSFFTCVKLVNKFIQSGFYFSPFTIYQSSWDIKPIMTF